MRLDKIIKGKDYIHTCPFCLNVLTVSENPQYKAQGQVGYECPKCYIPDVQTHSGAPYSRYNCGVMKDVNMGDGRVFEQVVVHDTFFMPHKDGTWYSIHNNVIKGQTTIVLMEPARQEHITFKDEKPYGMIWVGDPVFLPFVDSWDPGNQEGTFSKIQTYLLFL